MPFVNLTLATFLNAELGFFGVCVFTCKHTPLFCGQLFSAGDFVFFFFSVLPNLINWLIVGIILYLSPLCVFNFCREQACLFPTYSFDPSFFSFFCSSASFTISIFA